ncbi:MAG: phosphoribosylanthranilate isomerase [Nitrospirae bacterium]|nr:phosphoribosylanthranilate isomerase [Nitrospirota bacterium]
MTFVKICGITNLDDALFASEAGADALGFVFYKKSPRHIEPEKARDIIKRLPPFATTVGVFADQTEAEIKGIIAETNIDIVQLHGEEPPEFCERLNKRVIKAIRVRSMESLAEVKTYKACALLLDTYDKNLKGGTGRIFNWEIAREAKIFNKIIIAGGLTPENVADAIKVAQPYAVDVSSGVEKEKGIKDHQKIKMFIKKAKQR